MRALRRSLTLGAALLPLLSCTRPEAPDPAGPGPAAVDLGQGWDARLAALFHHTPQGSRLIPRAWFLALERADDGTPFAAPAGLARYGLIAAADDAGTGLNPDRLPVGFAVEPEARPGAGPWIGLTCAACHTGEVSHRGARLRVEGAPANFDFDRFGADLDAAVQATRRDPARLQRLAARTGTTAAALRPGFEAYAQNSARHWSVQHPAVESGPARVDALGQIVNSIAVLHLTATPAELDANRQAPRAPVSYPSLWLAPKLDWVQWVPIASSPIARNAGEVLGVFGDSRLTPPGDPGRFASSVRYDGLHGMEVWLSRLRPPAWPEPLFGAIDPARWTQGRSLFQAECQGCHNMPPFRTTDPRLSSTNARYVRVSAVPLEVAGTDPAYVQALNARRVRTGALRDKFGGAEEVPAPLYFVEAVKAVLERGVRDASLSPVRLLDTGELRACPPATRRMVAQIPQPVGRYEVRGVCDLPAGEWLRRRPSPWSMPAESASAMKAGPLLGIWATGPFLHNGSVPTVYDLLSPPEERPRVFWTGGRELDTERLGFVSAQAPGLFRFDASLPGNGNGGHAFPRGGLTPAQRLAVVEYLKDPLRFGDVPLP